jgi:hypothetical protein
MARIVAVRHLIIRLGNIRPGAEARAADYSRSGTATSAAATRPDDNLHPGVWPPSDQATGVL